MAAGILPFALPGIVESTNKVGTGIVSSIDNWGLDKDKFGFARSQAALDRVRAQQEYLGQLRASGQSDWQSALQNVANSSNQNAQFNANSNALALGDVQMQCPDASLPEDPASSTGLQEFSGCDQRPQANCFCL